ncbi:MAG: RnfABCDGE type electron transport complex subunit G [Lachnospiraceae bacterium]|nr:RnfABCDGE type electron transport complex subunit G [Lachnospiraceae bacterium]
MKKNTIVKDTLILLAITLISGLLLGLVYDITKNPIAEAAEKAKQEAYAVVYPDAEFAADDALTKALESFKADDSDAKITEVMSANNGEGFVFSCEAKGYGGAIQLAVGVSKDSTITGLSVLSMSETPGLGAKCQDAGFQGNFKGIQSEKISTTKGDPEFDKLRISGATITSGAVTRAVNATLKFVAENAK